MPGSAPAQCLCPEALLLGQGGHLGVSSGTASPSYHTGL